MKNVRHRIEVGWMKWWSASGVICDKNVSFKLKKKFYHSFVRPAMIRNDCMREKVRVTHIVEKITCVKKIDINPSKKNK
ncbi:hypothetical protein Lal_00012811 [Lupinus albus]|nr:hypothetical protein Lal_00012811 [Lupinus albus]